MPFVDRLAQFFRAKRARTAMRFGTVKASCSSQ